ncbi:hypothetical protein LZ554_005624 [Drepanopeziza brunnea f. sp. 'monogermtubi']|nr:hypothetical protein LZ554_005624 [Drepanopeziza brunnea f. sp. 'monogermtubi']
MKFILPALFAILATAGVINPDKIGNIDTASLWANADALPAAIDFVVADPNTPLSKRGLLTSHLTACFDPAYNGRCTTMLAPAGQCYNLADLSRQISSATPDQFPEMFACTLFTEPDCRQTDGAREVRWPGNADLRTVGIDDRAQSFRCG